MFKHTVRSRPVGRKKPHLLGLRVYSLILWYIWDALTDLMFLLLVDLGELLWNEGRIQDGRVCFPALRWGAAAASIRLQMAQRGQQLLWLSLIIISARVLTEAPVCRRGEAAEARDDEEEEGGRKRIHFSLGVCASLARQRSMASSGACCDFLPAQSGPSAAGGAEESRGEVSEESREDAGRSWSWRLERSQHHGTSAHAHALHIRWAPFKIKLTTRTLYARLSKQTIY